MSRTKKKNSPKNQNITIDEHDTHNKDRLASRIAKRERKKQLLMEKQNAKARKKARRRLKRSENKVEKSRNDYIQQGMSITIHVHMHQVS